VVAKADLPAPAHAAPAPLAHGNAQVVMQAVPVDPLAGPVAARKPAAKPAKLAKAVKHNAAPVHVATADKPAAKPADKPAKKSNGIPALRMTADASRP
jgi:hypothetical protein